jgi:hypothetical protein
MGSDEWCEPVKPSPRYTARKSAGCERRDAWGRDGCQRLGGDLDSIAGRRAIATIRSCDHGRGRTAPDRLEKNTPNGGRPLSRARSRQRHQPGTTILDRSEWLNCSKRAVSKGVAPDPPEWKARPVLSKPVARMRAVAMPAPASIGRKLWRADLMPFECLDSCTPRCRR